jgi:YD repeat-containing protein
MSTEPFRRRYTYDAAGQLVAVEDDAGWRIEYEHDPSGNRVRRAVTGTGTGDAGDAGPSEPA